MKARPAPTCAPVPRARTTPPMAKEGSSPATVRASASIPEVVVLPCAPATATKSRPRAARARAWERWTTSWPRARAAASSGLASLIAVETTTTAPAGTCAASWPTLTPTPMRRSRSRAGPSWLSEPVTAAPSSASSWATTLMPAPPTPMRWKLRPLSGACDGTGAALMPSSWGTGSPRGPRCG